MRAYDCRFCPHVVEHLPCCFSCIRLYPCEHPCFYRCCSFHLQVALRVDACPLRVGECTVHTVHCFICIFILSTVRLFVAGLVAYAWCIVLCSASAVFAAAVFLELSYTLCLHRYMPILVRFSFSFLNRCLLVFPPGNEHMQHN